MPEDVQITERSLELEKLQLERERLSLERERLETERDKYRHTVALSNRASGRVTMPIGVFAFLLIANIIIGGLLSLWLTGVRVRPDSGALAASLAQAFDAASEVTSTNDHISASTPLLRALNGTGRRGGYLLILD